MSTAPFITDATYADIESLPEHKVGEIVNGELHVLPRPSPAHARALGRMYSQLDRRFDEGHDGPGGWIILPEVELRVAGDVLVPDLAGWRVETLPGVPLQQAYIDTRPDWLCEISSPRTAQHDRVVKLPRYHALGVPHVWIVDPSIRVIDVLTRRDSGWLLRSFGGDADEPLRLPPFDAVGLDVTRWWVQPPPSEGDSSPGVA